MVVGVVSVMLLRMRLCEAGGLESLYMCVCVHEGWMR